MTVQMETMLVTAESTALAPGAEQCVNLPPGFLSALL